jgi:DNA invertase Pin-like site-specific DNA recombinase
MIACVVLRIGNIWSRAAGGIVSLRIGYARVSTKRQSLTVQINGLREAGCDIIFTDTASGGEDARRGLQRALRKCRAGDRFVVWRLDRLSRRLIHLVGTVEHLTGRGVHLQVLNGRGTNADFSEPEGRFVLGVIASFAQLELETCATRTRQALGIRTFSSPQGSVSAVSNKRRLLLEHFLLVSN